MMNVQRSPLWGRVNMDCATIAAVAARSVGTLRDCTGGRPNDFMNDFMDLTMTRGSDTPGSPAGEQFDRRALDEQQRLEVALERLDRDGVDGSVGRVQRRTVPASGSMHGAISADPTHPPSSPNHAIDSGVGVWNM